MTVPPGSSYVAMGSSYAAGPGIPPVVDRGAFRSGRNYAHLVAAALDLHLVDVTCSGATTEHLLTARQRTVTGSRPPQIEAVTADTRLVTVTAGGNDLSYIGALTAGSARAVLARRLPARIGDRLRAGTDFSVHPGQVEAVTTALVTVVDAVRARAPQAQVVLVDYLPVVGPGPASCLPLTPAQVDQVRLTAAGLAGAFAAAAGRSGADLVDATAAGRDHGACSPEPWTTGFRFAVPFLPGPAPYHPTAAGMAAVADLVTTVVQDVPNGGG